MVDASNEIPAVAAVAAARFGGSRQRVAGRSSRDSFFRIGALTNAPLALTVAMTFLLQMMVTYTPFWQDLLSTRALTGEELAVSLSLATLPFWTEEAYKWARRRR